MCDGWKALTIEECLTSEFSGEWGTDPTAGGNATVFRSTDVDDSGHVVGAGARRTIQVSKLVDKRLRPGDILLEASGGGPAKPVGRVAVFPGSMDDCLCSNFFRTLRPNPKVVDPGFLAWRLQYAYALPTIWVFQQQTTGIINLKVRDYMRTPVKVPHLSEQRRIAEILDTLDEAICKTQQLIAKLKKTKQGLLQDLLTRGVDENGELRDSERHPELFRDSPLGQIPADWALSTLGAVADVDRGKFGHRPRNDPAFYGGPFPFIQTGDIAGADGGVLKTFSQTLNERGRSVSREFPAGSIAITIAANIADTALLGIPMYFPDSVVGAVVHAPHVPRFVELCIRRAKRGLDARAPQSAQKNINLQDLRPLPIGVPSQAEQQRIAACYDVAALRVDQEGMALNKLRVLRQGLMEDLLTGRVRVHSHETAA